MPIPDLQVTAIKSEGREAWTVVTVEFQRQDGDYQGDGQWPDALETAARVMESETWRVYWQQPHFVEREIYDDGPPRLVAVEQPENPEAFSSWSLARVGGWVACYSY
jgi:hypothetical protein